MDYERFDRDVRELVQAIHTNPVNPVKVVIAMAGNGLDGVAHLMRHGNGSATLIGQHLFYSQTMAHEYIGSKVGKMVSQPCARYLAMAAYHEALSCAEAGDVVAGVGSTTSLVKPDGEREGRQHLIHVAVQTRSVTRWVTLELQPGRSREEEEWLAGMIILGEIARLRGHVHKADRIIIPSVGDHDGHTSDSVNAALSFNLLIEVVHGERDCFLWLNGMPTKNFNLNAPHAFFPGSFNPIHDGHRRMIDIAAKKLDLPVLLEMSVTNVDKPPMDYIDFQKRMSLIGNQPVVVSNAPKFYNKSDMLPKGSIFIVGMDTMKRIVDPAYGADALTGFEGSSIRKNGNKFLVFCRDVGGKIESVTDLPRYEQIKDLIIPVSPDEFLSRTSSTAIRDATQ